MSACAVCADRHGPKLFAILKFSAFQRIIIHPDPVRCYTKWILWAFYPIRRIKHISTHMKPSPGIQLSRLCAGLENRGYGFDSRLGQFHDSHCDKILSSLTTDHHFEDGFVGKQPGTLKEY